MGGMLALLTGTVDWNQLAQTIFSNLPATVAAIVAAAIAWHNREISKSINTTSKETKTMVNGRMDQLLNAAAELAEIKGRQAASIEATLLKAATDKAVTNFIKDNIDTHDRRSASGLPPLS